MLRLIFTFAIFVFAPTAYAQDFSSKYLNDEPIMLIQDKHERARAWATCAAVYDTAAMFSEKEQNKAAEAKKFSEMANGAELAVGMTFVLDMIENANENNTELLTQKFNATWTYAKTAMTEIPATIKTNINVNLESALNGGVGLDSELTDLYGAVGICLKNVKAQQEHINLWRELATSGLLTLPE